MCLLVLGTLSVLCFSKSQVMLLEHSSDNFNVDVISSSPAVQVLAQATRWIRSLCLSRLYVYSLAYSFVMVMNGIALSLRLELNPLLGFCYRWQGLVAASGCLNVFLLDPPSRLGG